MSLGSFLFLLDPARVSMSLSSPLARTESPDNGPLPDRPLSGLTPGLSRVELMPSLGFPPRVPAHHGSSWDVHTGTVHRHALGTTTHSILYQPTGIRISSQ